MCGKQKFRRKNFAQTIKEDFEKRNISDKIVNTDET
jgi:hypothetical protein